MSEENQQKDSKSKVLIVEDNSVNRAILSKALSQEYETQEAENGKDALALLDDSANHYAAVVLDLLMPVMNGYAFLEEVHRRGLQNLPILVMTGDSDPQAEKRVFDLGAWDYVTKPIQTQTLLSRLRNAIARSQVSLLKELQYVLAHDTLTGLYNRGRLFLEIAQKLSAEPEKQYAFVRIDIDRFHLFNSAMGEQEGDRLLQYLAQQLHNTTADFTDGVYGRMESDVFCIFAEYQKEKLETALAVLQNQLRSYRKDYVLELSFGVCVVDQPGIIPETMLARATLALEKGKGQHQHGVFYFDASMEERAALEKEINGEMQTALEQKQFLVYLQPKYELRTEKNCGAEALVRWNRPGKGIVSPAVFIPVFEQNGFIARLDYYMWASVCALLKKWKDEGRELLPISVNMSRISLYNPQVVEILVGLVQHYDIPAQMLNLEVTESAYMSNTSLMKDTICRLQKAGFSILMDDFGSGYSSLNTLKEIQVDVLKIDMRFMPASDSDGKSEIILSSIIRMAGWLGMPVIAEGVETAEQKRFLDSIGCGFVQGYYYARPMPVEEYEKLLTNSCAVPNRPQKVLKPIEAVWSADQRVDDILKSISLPVAIYECSVSGAEIVRVNEAYNHEFDYQKDVARSNTQLSYENLEKLRVTFHRALQNRNTEICEFSWKSPQGNLKWYRLKLQYLEQTAGASLLCGIYMEITAEKKYEDKLERIFQYLEVPQRKSKMLIVDDQKMSRDILSGMFADKYDILEAEEGGQALEQALRCQKELTVILLDMNMPGMNGEEFLNQKNALPEIADIPVVVISANTSSAVQRGMLRLGVHDYITKPFVPEMAVRRVENVIEYSSRFHDLMQEYHTLAPEA